MKTEGWREMPLNVIIKSANSEKCEVTAEAEMTIGELKESVIVQMSLSPVTKEQLRFIYKGKAWPHHQDILRTERLTLHTHIILLLASLFIIIIIIIIIILNPVFIYISPHLSPLSPLPSPLFALCFPCSPLYSLSPFSSLPTPHSPLPTHHYSLLQAKF